MVMIRPVGPGPPWAQWRTFPGRPGQMVRWIGKHIYRIYPLYPIPTGIGGLPPPSLLSSLRFFFHAKKIQ